MSDYEMILALSGTDEKGYPKANVGLYHELFGSDGSVQLKDELCFQKPEIKIFKDYNNIVRIDFIYDSYDDQDLYEHYAFLERFFQPENSVSFSEEELDLLQQQESDIEDGYNIPEEEKIVIYSHALTLNISSLIPLGKVSLTTKDIPLMYHLVQDRPGEHARIIRMLYQKDDVQFIELSDDVLSDLDNSASAEAENSLE